VTAPRSARPLPPYTSLRNGTWAYFSTCQCARRQLLGATAACPEFYPGRRDAVIDAGWVGRQIRGVYVE
jgi:hypothetical protein